MTPRPAGRRWLGRAALLAKILVTFGILGALAWRYHGDVPSLGSLPAWATAGAVALLLVQPALVGWRWVILLRGYRQPAPPGTLVAVTWVSVFANQFLPAGVGGDAVRVFYAVRLGTGLGAAAASVLLDRIMALLALMLLILLLAPPLAEAVAPDVALWIDLACVAGLLGFAGAVVLARRVRWRPANPLLRRVMDVAAYVLTPGTRPLALVAAVALSLLVHLLSFAAFLVILRGLGVGAAAAPLVAVAALLALIQVIPISIGGWGVREAAAVALLAPLGVEAGPALLASLLLGLCYAAASLPGAVIWPFIRPLARPLAHRIRDAAVP